MKIAVLVILVLCLSDTIRGNYHQKDLDGETKEMMETKGQDSTEERIESTLKRLLDEIEDRIEKRKLASQRENVQVSKEANTQKRQPELVSVVQNSDKRRQQQHIEGKSDEKYQTSKTDELKRMLQLLATKLNNKKEESEETESKSINVLEPSKKNFGPHGLEENDEDVLSRNFGPSGQEISKTKNQDFEDISENEWEDDKRNFGPGGKKLEKRVNINEALFASQDETEDVAQKRNFSKWGKSLREVIDEEIEKMLMKKQAMK